MLATKLTRAVQRVSSPFPVATVSCTQLTNSSRSTHQRRRSSSKASCPPDDSNKPTPTTKTASDSINGPATVIQRKRTSKYRRTSQDKLSRTKESEQSSAYAALPVVPGVDHLDAKDISFSSFFSLHRPLSLNNPFPPTVTEETFASIFETKAEQDPWANGNSAERRPEDVIYALSQTIESIENASAAAQNEVVHIDVLTEAANSEEGARHLDSLSKTRIPTLDEIVAQARPFQAPPPPQPFNNTKSEKKRATRQSKQAGAKTKSYSTTIVVTESRLPNGQTTYEASASPIVRLPDTVVESSTVSTSGVRARAWIPYRRRKSEASTSSIRHLRQQHNIRSPSAVHRIRQAPSTGRSTSMLLISVKRQRKLKMKKHKYKKLMKRTRNLRRKLENK